jgi:hypothetical protein
VLLLGFRWSPSLWIEIFSGKFGFRYLNKLSFGLNISESINILETGESDWRDINYARESLDHHIYFDTLMKK